MKIATVLTLAAMLAAGTATHAGALMAVHGLSEAEALAAESAHGAHGIDPVVYDRCHGQSSGTAHPHCGTATGGPVGGLF